MDERLKYITTLDKRFGIWLASAIDILVTKILKAVTSAAELRPISNNLNEVTKKEM